MKYAVIKSGSKQIKVQVGKPIWIDKVNAKVGDTYHFNNIFALNDGESLHVGNPNLKAEVNGIVQKHGKGPKLIIFRTKAKSNWKRKQGHRQEYTRILITEMVFGNKKIDEYKPPVESADVDNQIKEETKEPANNKKVIEREEMKGKKLSEIPNEKLINKDEEIKKERKTIKATPQETLNTESDMKEVNDK